MVRSIIKYNVSPELEKQFREVIMEMTEHEAQINSLYSWSAEHGDEIDINVNFDFVYKNEEYIHGFYSVPALREWLKEVLN